jgi:hypothetical protein
MKFTVQVMDGTTLKKIHFPQGTSDVAKVRSTILKECGIDPRKGTSQERVALASQIENGEDITIGDKLFHIVMKDEDGQIVPSFEFPNHGELENDDDTEEKDEKQTDEKPVCSVCEKPLLASDQQVHTQEHGVVHYGCYDIMREEDRKVRETKREHRRQKYAKRMEMLFDDTLSKVEADVDGVPNPEPPRVCDDGKERCTFCRKFAPPTSAAVVQSRKAPNGGRAYAHRHCLRNAISQDPTMTVMIYYAGFGLILPEDDVCSLMYEWAKIKSMVEKQFRENFERFKPEPQILHVETEKTVEKTTEEVSQDDDFIPVAAHFSLADKWAESADKTIDALTEGMTEKEPTIEEITQGKTGAEAMLALLNSF